MILGNVQLQHLKSGKTYSVLFYDQDLGFFIIFI